MTAAAKRYAVTLELYVVVHIPAVAEDAVLAERLARRRLGEAMAAPLLNGIVVGEYDVDFLQVEEVRS